MIVMCSLILLPLKQLKACKTATHICFVILYFQTIAFKFREHFNNRNSGADVSGHDVKSLKQKESALNLEEHFKRWVLFLLTNHF